MTPAAMNGLKLHQGWSDGRKGYVWCRFDARLSRDHYNLRAELTWDDTELSDGTVVEYMNPMLLIETNKRVGRTLERVDCVVIRPSERDAIELLASDPSTILDRYAEQVNKLRSTTDAMDQC